MSLPILYSFRRCPYAMRARWALAYCHLDYELREVVLKDKPQEMLDLSPKGTVPVMVVDGHVIEESLEIMLWATDNTDSNWLTPAQRHEHLALIEHNDRHFKPWLDRYKYADRHPEHSELYYRQQGEQWLFQLEARLQQQPFLAGDQFGFLDAAIAPFIRQFAHVDKAWFDDAPYPNLRAWLNARLNSELFKGIMSKYPAYQRGQDVVQVVNATQTHCTF